MLRSLRQAARQLAHARAFSATVVLTLALGLCAATAVFTIVNAVLLRPLPYPEPDRLVSLSHTLVVGTTMRVEQSDATLLLYGRHQRSFTHIGGYQIATAGLGPIGGGEAERLPSARVSSGFFPALRVSPVRGRLFTDDDDRPGAQPVALISDRLWIRKFGADPSIVGRRIDIDGERYDVIGVMPAAGAPAAGTELWVPLRLNAAHTEAATFDYQAIARLRSGVTIAAASAELQSLLLRISDEFPGRMSRTSIEQTQMRASIRPLAEVVIGDIGRVLWIVLAAAALVLVIACANCANLFLVRAESRRDEVAVKLALGASPGAIVMEMLAEASLVACAAAAIALAGAVSAIVALRSLGDVADIPRLAELGVDATVVVALAAGAASVAIVLAAVPAIRLARDASASLPSSGRSATADRGRHRIRQALVASQVALALVLLTGSGLLMRSLWRLRSVPLGFDPSNALSLRVALPPAVYPAADDAVRFVVRAEQQMATLPGVVAVGAVSKLPLDEQGRTDTAVFVEDRPLPAGTLPGIHPVSYVTPEYFRAAGIPMIAGRAFAEPAPPRVDHEVVVSRAFARRYWNDQPAIGKRLRIYLRGPWYTVVGVVGSVRDTALDRAEDQTLYCPLLPAREDPRWEPRDIALVVRTDRDRSAVLGAARSTIRTLDPSLALYRIRHMTEIVAHATARRTFTLAVVGCASAIALLLGAIGLYSVMAYVVALRTREMAIRIALGAEPTAIVRMVSRQGIAVAAVGIAIGLAGALFLTRFLTALLFEVSPVDPSTFAAASALLLAVATAASWLPARRAAGVEPAMALRAE